MGSLESSWRGGGWHNGQASRPSAVPDLGPRCRLPAIPPLLVMATACGGEQQTPGEDNFDDPSRAVEVARKLVEQDKVFAMVGSLDDAPHPASWEYLNEKGGPDILVSAGGHRFGADPQAHPWTFQMIPSYTIEGAFFGQHISENLSGKTVAVLWRTTTWSTPRPLMRSQWKY